MKYYKFVSQSVQIASFKKFVNSNDSSFSIEQLRSIPSYIPMKENEKSSAVI